MAITRTQPEPNAATTAGRWRLQDAKARLSELVRQAQTEGPQRVSVHGRDAVVVMSAEEFDRLKRPVTGQDIIAALSSAPLPDASFERLSEKAPVRDIGF